MLDSSEEEGFALAACRTPWVSTVKPVWMDITDPTGCLLMRTTLVAPVTVTLWGPSVLSVLRMTFTLTYTEGSGQVSVHAKKVMRERNVIAAISAIRVTRSVCPVTATQLAA